MPSDQSLVLLEGRRRSRKFVVTLCQQADEMVIVKSCEVIGDGFRNRTSFQQQSRMGEVFKKAIAEGIEGALAGLKGTSEVRSLPDLTIQTNGLILAGLHLIVTAAENDELHIICRFNSFLGGVNHAFHPHIGFESSAPEEMETLSALVFADLVLPVLNICQAAQQVAEAGSLPSEPMARALSERWQELQFRVELLKRFVQFTPVSPAVREAPVFNPVQGAVVHGCFAEA